MYDNILLNYFLKWEMFQTIFIEKIKTHILFSIACGWKMCSLWDNVENYGRAKQAIADNTVHCMHTACWITKAADICSEYEILIAFPWQYWLHECASMLCLYVHCLSSWIACTAIKSIFLTAAVSLYFIKSVLLSFYITCLISVYFLFQKPIECCFDSL